MERDRNRPIGIALMLVSGRRCYRAAVLYRCCQLQSRSHLPLVHSACQSAFRPLHISSTTITATTPHLAWVTNIPTKHSAAQSSSITSQIAQVPLPPTGSHSLLLNLAAIISTVTATGLRVAPLLVTLVPPTPSSPLVLPTPHQPQQPTPHRRQLAPDVILSSTLHAPYANINVQQRVETHEGRSTRGGV